MDEKYIYLFCILGFVLLLNISLISSFRHTNTKTNIFGNMVQIAKNPWKKDQDMMKNLSDKVKDIDKK